MPTLFNIAATSRRTGIAPDTLRKWEQRCLSAAQDETHEALREGLDSLPTPPTAALAVGGAAFGAADAATTGAVCSSACIEHSVERIRALAAA